MGSRLVAELLGKATQVRPPAISPASLSARRADKIAGMSFRLLTELLEGAKQVGLPAPPRPVLPAIPPAPPMPGMPGLSRADRGASLAVGALGCIIVGAVGAAVVAFVFVWWLQRRLKSHSPDDESFLETLSGLPPRFSFKELQVATNNFETRLGGGGFGVVYEGTLSTGAKIAVKKLNWQVGSQDFRAEVATVGGIHHNNLVRLHGFCAQGSHRMLVYEFVANGSLDKWIFPFGEEKNSKGKTLSWSRRFNVVLGTARGLSYLHDDCARRIVHFDIKPQNILVDENFVPKVADFGLSRISDRDVSSEMMTSLKGTPGYVAPEWILGVATAEKGDVFSYGLVLFEILSGRKNLIPSNKSGSVYFPAFALREVTDRGYGRDSLSKLFDPRLNGSFDEQQGTRMLKVAFWCIQEDPEGRPTMREVVLMLAGKLPILDPPPMRFAGMY